MLRLTTSDVPSRQPRADDLPETIASCRVISLLGEGASGLVYLAEQSRPHRKVAIKVLRSGLATPASLRRLEREAEIMARMRHPGIAQVFESGVDRGGPYFMMEYVEGESITHFAEQRNLTIPERLRLFLQVCDAVQHAHSMGVIHRDLKPANILMTGAGRPKVLDFGVARALEPDPRHQTFTTSFGQLVGTLAYMSPEQAGGDTNTVDTRTDVYALGGILFQLLAGSPPLDVAGKPLPEALRIIQEVPAPRLGGIIKHCRGDIETIVAKALEKRADRRYASVSELAGDISRHLDRLPIHARPPSALYEIARFADRHRSLVAGVLIALTSIIAALGWSVVQRYREHQNYLAAKGVVGSWIGEAMYTLQPVQESYGPRRRMLAAARAPLEQFAKLNPTDRDAQGNLAAVAFALGNLRSEEGNLTEAMEHYQHAYRILGELTSRPGAKLRWRLDQSIAAVRIGDILHTWNRSDEAAPWHIQALALDLETVRRFPYNYTANDQLLWSYDRLTHAAIARGDLGTAGVIADELRRTAADIVARWPDSPKALWCELSAIETIAFLDFQRGDAHAFADGRRLGIHLRRRLIEIDPANRGYQLVQIRALIGAAEEHIARSASSARPGMKRVELRHADELLKEAQPMVTRALLSEGHEAGVRLTAACFHALRREICQVRGEHARASQESYFVTYHAKRAFSLEPSALFTINSAAARVLAEITYLCDAGEIERANTLTCWLLDAIADMIVRFPGRAEPYFHLAGVCGNSPALDSWNPSLASLAATRAEELMHPRDVPVLAAKEPAP